MPSLRSGIIVRGPLTPRVLLRYIRPLIEQTFQELIERGASGDILNRNQIPAVTVVNQFYDKLGDMMLDRLDVS